MEIVVFGSPYFIDFGFKAFASKRNQSKIFFLKRTIDFHIYVNRIINLKWHSTTSLHGSVQIKFIISNIVFDCLRSCPPSERFSNVFSILNSFKCTNSTKWKQKLKVSFRFKAMQVNNMNALDYYEFWIRIVLSTLLYHFTKHENDIFKFATFSETISICPEKNRSN